MHVYLSTGHLLYVVDATMYAAPFDAAQLAITGPAVPVIVGVGRSTIPNFTASHAAVAESGTLAYVPGFATAAAPMFQFLLSDRRGRSVPLDIPPGTYSHPRVSPDGRLLAVAKSEGQSSDVWIYDLAGNSAIRKLTFGGNNRLPEWSFDSLRVTFQSDGAIAWQPADGSGTIERLTNPVDGEAHIPEAWSPGGRRLLLSVAKAPTLFVLSVLNLDGRNVQPFGQVQSAEPLNASFSPDGTWVAYAFADRPGPNTPNRGVFVERFPPVGQKYQVPRSFADFHPVWSRDGKSIFYVPTAARPIVSVPIRVGSSVTFGNPVEPDGAPRPNLRSADVRGFDILPDGRFLSVSQVFGDGARVASAGEIRVVLNWSEELKRLVPTK